MCELQDPLRDLTSPASVCEVQPALRYLTNPASVHTCEVQRALGYLTNHASVCKGLVELAAISHKDTLISSILSSLHPESFCCTYFQLFVPQTFHLFPFCSSVSVINAVASAHVCECVCVCVRAHSFATVCACACTCVCVRPCMRMKTIHLTVTSVLARPPTMQTSELCRALQ